MTAPLDLPEALDQFRDGSAYLAGGTTLVDLMKLEVLTPGNVLDISLLPLRGIRTEDGGVYIGALERMSDVAEHELITAAYPVLSQALAASASPQLRDMATIGGNLLQRTRCGYYRDPAVACNKRVPGAGCPAIEGANRMHAILGTSDACVATHPSDLAVALVALDASVELIGDAGHRRVPLAASTGSRAPSRTWRPSCAPVSWSPGWRFRRCPRRAGRSTSRFATGSRTSSR